MIFGWNFAGDSLSLGHAGLEQLALELWERDQALPPPSERQDQMLRVGPSRWSHGIKAATFQSTPLPQAFEEAARGFVL